MSGTLVSNQIRRLRFDRGEMTQQALADACGVTRGSRRFFNGANRDEYLSGR